MKTIKNLFNFYIYSSLHVALSACALTWVTLIQLDLQFDKTSLGFVFFSTITGYNFVKYFGLAKFHHRSLANWLKATQIISFIAFLALCYYAYLLHSKALYIGLLSGTITFFYAMPMLPKSFLFDEHKNLRQISGLKVYIIALVWTLATVLVPLLNNEASFNNDVIVICFQRFVYVLVLMLPFEIRDLNYDSLKLATIPQRIGIKKTKAIGVLLLMLFMMLEFFKTNLSEKVATISLVIMGISMVFVVFSNKNKSKYYSAFWVESLPVFWLFLLLMFR